jgi:hypothetical protein
MVYSLIIPVWENDGEHLFLVHSNTFKEAAKSGRWPICYEKRPKRDSESSPSEGVGCKLEFKPLLATDTNLGSAFPNDIRPDERSYGQ